MELIKDGNALNVELKAIKVAGAKLDARIQRAALSAIWHFGVRTNDKGDLIGDVGFINRLYLSLGKGARHVAMTAWLLEFGGVQANTGEGKDTTPFVKDKNKAVDMEGGDKTKWFDMAPSKKPDEVLDIMKLVQAVLKKAAKPKEGQAVTHAAMLPELQALVEKFGEEAEELSAAGVDDTEED